MVFNKNRLIGLIVLIAFAVIFGQFCLNYYKDTHYHVSVYRSPPLSPLTNDELSSDNAPKIETRDSLLEQAIKHDKNENIALLPALEEKYDKEGSFASAWIVQVAILSNQNSADLLLRQLKEHELDAFVESFMLNEKIMYKVALGPFVKQELAINALTSLQESLKMTGILKQYSVIEESDEKVK